MHTAAIVVAAGRGTRMGTATGKAFLELGGRPLASYCLQTLNGLRGLVSIVLVTAAEHRENVAALLHSYGPWSVPICLATGGPTRQDSVAAGLALVDSAAELVLIHDAARPFVSLSCIEACVEAAATTGAAIVALAARDTVKLAAEDSASNVSVVQTLDRRRIWLAQTPQVFRTTLLRQAYEQACHSGYVATDDAALVERMGVQVRIVAGDTSNHKITTPEDLRWAECYLRESGRSNA